MPSMRTGGLTVALVLDIELPVKLVNTADSVEDACADAEPRLPLLPVAAPDDAAVPALLLLYALPVEEAVLDAAVAAAASALSVSECTSLGRIRDVNTTLSAFSSSSRIGVGSWSSASALALTVCGNPPCPRRSARWRYMSGSARTSARARVR